MRLNIQYRRCMVNAESSDEYIESTILQDTMYSRYQVSIIVVKPSVLGVLVDFIPFLIPVYGIIQI